MSKTHSVTVEEVKRVRQMSLNSRRALTPEESEVLRLMGLRQMTPEESREVLKRSLNEAWRARKHI